MAFSRMTLVAIVLHEHQADNDKMWAVGEVIKKCALEKKAPFTFSMTGITVEAIARCCPEVAGWIKQDFANLLNGWDPHKPEIVITTYNNMPIMLPGLPLDYLGAFFEGFAVEQVNKSRGTLERDLHRTPRGFFPSEMIFAPAAAHVIKQQDLHYCLIGGEYLGNRRREKGQVYYVGDNEYNYNLKLLVRVNDINIFEPSKTNSYGIKEEIKCYARSNGIERIIVGCDLGHFTGLYEREHRNGLTLHDGIARLCCLADELYADPEMHFVNCGAIADSYWHPLKIYDLYREMGIPDPHHFTTTWMNAEGNLGNIDHDKMREMIDFVIYHTTELRKTELWDHDRLRWLQAIKEDFFWRSGMERYMRW